VEVTKKAKIVEFNLGNKKVVGVQRRSQLRCWGPSNRDVTAAGLRQSKGLSLAQQQDWQKMAVGEHKNGANI